MLLIFTYDDFKILTFLYRGDEVFNKTNLFVLFKIISNFGDSVFSQLIVIAIIFESTNPQRLLGINTFLLILPSLIMILTTTKLNKIKNRKRLLVINEFAILSLIIGFSLLMYIYHSMILLLLGASILYLLSYIKLLADYEILRRNYECDSNDKPFFVNISHVYLARLVGYVPSIVIDLITYVLSIFNYVYIYEELGDDDTTKNNFNETKTSFQTHFIRHTLFDGVLAGFNTLINTLLPLHLFRLEIFYVYPVFLIANCTAWLLGMYLTKYISKFVKSIRLIFIIDYTLSLLFFISILLNVDIYIVLVLFLIAKTIQSSTSIIYDHNLKFSYSDRLKVATTTILILLMFSLTLIFFSTLTMEIVLVVATIISVITIVYFLVFSKI